MVTTPSGGDCPVPTSDDLITAARHLGEPVVPRPLTPDGGGAADRLSLSAIVLGAAERQMLTAESEFMQAPSDRQAFASATRITAQVACGDHVGKTRVWLGWRAGHLLNQLDAARGSGVLDADVLTVAADAVHAAALILHAAACSHDSAAGSLPPATAAKVRGTLASALQALDRADYARG